MWLEQFWFVRARRDESVRAANAPALLMLHGFQLSLREPEAEGSDIFVRQVFVAGHVGSGDAKLDDSREAIPAFGKRKRFGDMQERPDS